MSAITLARIMMTKAGKASSFRAHTDPQADFSLEGIILLYSRCIPKVYSISHTLILCRGCQKILWFHPGNSLLFWSVRELGESRGQSGLDFCLGVCAPCLGFTEARGRNAKTSFLELFVFTRG